MNNGTEIKCLMRGDACPTCGKQNTNPIVIEVKDKKGSTRKIVGLKCRCGTIYLTKKMYSKISMPNMLNIKRITRTDADPALTKKGGKKVLLSVNMGNTSKLTKNGKVKVCRKCGSPGVFLGSDLCWDCYKEEKQSMFT